MIKKLFQLLNRHRIIMDRENGEPYLERYYIFLKDRKSFPFNIFLHKFLKGDPADVHDHPWSYRTFILWGGYWEWTPIFNELGKMTGEQRKWCGAGHTRQCTANTYHRIELESGVPCWTLFMPGRKEREWGFLANNSWIPHEQYFENRMLNKSKKYGAV
jgi:hypothetical protein